MRLTWCIMCEAALYVQLIDTLKLILWIAKHERNQAECTEEMTESFMCRKKWKSQTHMGFCFYTRGHRLSEQQCLPGKIIKQVSNVFFCLYWPQLINKIKNWQRYHLKTQHKVCRNVVLRFLWLDIISDPVWYLAYSGKIYYRDVTENWKY